MTKTILLVDDSRMSRMMMKAIVLGKKPNWQVIEASDGEAAIALTQNQKFDIATLDLNMPGMDGLELAEKLMKNHPDSTYALLTANIQDVVRQKALALGLEFIEKPISAEKNSNIPGTFLEVRHCI